jgi:triosephosphate isomerase
MHMLISGWIMALIPGSKPVILYGGSVRKENAGAYFQESHIDGVLVGGASTKLETWSEIIQAAESVLQP